MYPRGLPRRKATELGCLHAERQDLLLFLADIERCVFVGKVRRRRGLLLHFFGFLRFTISLLLVAFGHLISSNVLIVALANGLLTCVVEFTQPSLHPSGPRPSQA